MYYTKITFKAYYKLSILIIMYLIIKYLIIQYYTLNIQQTNKHITSNIIKITN